MPLTSDDLQRMLYEDGENWTPRVNTARTPTVPPTAPRAKTQQQKHITPPRPIVILSRRHTRLMADEEKRRQARADTTPIVPQRGIRHSDGDREIAEHMTQDRLARFWAKVDKHGPFPLHRPELGPCWLWIGGKSRGYGKFKTGEKLRQAHRVAYVITYGPLPADMEPDHVCRNRGCVNPSHMEPVTNKENAKRALPFKGQTKPADHCAPAGRYKSKRSL